MIIQYIQLDDNGDDGDDGDDSILLVLLMMTILSWRRRRFWCLNAAQQPAHPQHQLLQFLQFVGKTSNFSPKFFKGIFCCCDEAIWKTFLGWSEKYKKFQFHDGTPQEGFYLQETGSVVFSATFDPFHIFIYRTRNKHKKFKWRTFNQTAVGCRTFHSECEKCSCFLLQMMRMMVTMMMMMTTMMRMMMTIMTKFKLPAAAVPVISCSPFKAAPRLNPNRLSLVGW